MHPTKLDSAESVPRPFRKACCDSCSGNLNRLVACSSIRTTLSRVLYITLISDMGRKALASV